MSAEKMREEFEAWATPEGYVMECIWGGDGNHGYEDEDTQYAWGLFQHAWQASRAAIEVELPRQHGVHYPRMFSDEVRTALESLGLKVKP